MANLFPAELDLAAIITQVEQLAQVLSDVSAERCVSCSSEVSPPLLTSDPATVRYALTLRIMLANLRRKLGLSSIGPAGSLTPGGSTMPMPPADVMVPPGFAEPGGVPAPLTMEELGFTAWPSDRGAFNPSSIPAWLQEQVRMLPFAL